MQSGNDIGKTPERQKLDTHGQHTFGNHMRLDKHGSSFHLLVRKYHLRQSLHDGVDVPHLKSLAPARSHIMILTTMYIRSRHWNQRRVYCHLH